MPAINATRRWRTNATGDHEWMSTLPSRCRRLLTPATQVHSSHAFQSRRLPMMVRRPSPFGELISLRRTMDRVLDDPFFQMPMPRQTRRMPLDVFDTPDALVLEAALPGVAPADIEVSVLGDVLTLTAGTDATEAAVRGGHQVREVRRGRMTRSVTLPRDLRTDEASASSPSPRRHLSSADGSPSACPTRPHSRPRPPRRPVGPRQFLPRT